MNLLDIAVVAVIGLSALFAFARGFVREVLSIAAWLGAAAIAVYGFDDAFRLTATFVKTPLIAELVAGAGLFLISLVVLTILTGYAARFVQASAASPIDRTLGLIFGVARGALLVSVAYLFFDVALPPNERPEWIKEAKTGPYLAQGADFLRGLLPADWQLKGLPTVDEAQQALGHAREARRAMRALENPTGPPTTSPGQQQAPGYNADERHDLDRLIQNAH
jgi:membrane protein required for colicin V production